LGREGGATTGVGYVKTRYTENPGDDHGGHAMSVLRHVRFVSGCCCFAVFVPMLAARWRQLRYWPPFSLPDIDSPRRGGKTKMQYITHNRLSFIRNILIYVHLQCLSFQYFIIGSLRLSHSWQATNLAMILSWSHIWCPFSMIISSCSMIDQIQLLNLIFKSITSPKFLAHYVNCLRLHIHQMRSEFDGFHSLRLACIHKIDHNS
jgi:hypothetical protein